MKARIAIVIATYNRRDSLMKSLQHLHSLETCFPVVVVDNASTDWVVEILLDKLQTEGCAFVGAFPAGLSHRGDVRPEQQIVEYWDGPVRPEVVEPGAPQWERWQLHLAANLYHAGLSLTPGEFRLYKVAWIASCILYDRARLPEVGGFSFSSRLPRYHSGEEVLVQNLLMRR